MENMKFINLAKSRYSMRRFDARPIVKEDLESILEAGRLAPTAVDYQPQRILVIQDSEGLEKIKRSTKFHFNAPCILVLCYDVNASWKNPHGRIDSGTMDVSIIATHMMLQATDIGMGSTFVGHFDAPILKEDFNIPDYLTPVALLPIGYPSELSKPHPLHAKRKPLCETVFYDSYDGLIKGEIDEDQHKTLI